MSRLTETERLTNELEQEFYDVLNQYIEKFGHTFTSLGIHPGVQYFYVAMTQMEDALAGDRGPVTNESIGMTGESAFG